MTQVNTFILDTLCRFNESKGFSDFEATETGKKKQATVENEKFNNTKSKGNKIKTKQKNKTQKNSVAAPNLKSSVQQRK